MPDGLKSGCSAAARRILEAVGRLSGGLRTHLGDRSKKIGRFGAAMERVDETGARGIALLPTVRALLAEPKERAHDALRVGLNGYYGRPDKDGRRLYLDIQSAKFHQEQPSFSRDLHVGGSIYLDDQQRRRFVGGLEFDLVETRQGKLVVNLHSVRLQKDVQGRGFTRDYFLRLRGYSKRSGVEHIKTWATEDGGLGWAGVFDWDPDWVVSNRKSMLGRIDQIMVQPDHAADRAVLRELQSAFRGPPESWPPTGELRKLQGESSAVGRQILQGSSWYGIYRL